jgi:hypothetical protein
MNQTHTGHLGIDPVRGDALLGGEFIKGSLSMLVWTILVGKIEHRSFACVNLSVSCDSGNLDSTTRLTAFWNS